MFDLVFDELELTNFERLVENGTPEGRQLEFKRDHYGNGDNAKKEFAADISAMANALGGILIIGIEEKNGIASKIVGVESDDTTN